MIRLQYNISNVRRVDSTLSVYLWKEPVPSLDITSRKIMSSSISTTFPSHGQQHVLHFNTSPVF